MDIWVSRFLTITNKAAIKNSLQVFVWTYLFITFGQIPRNGIERSSSKCLFNFMTAKLFSKVAEISYIPATEDVNSSCTVFLLTLDIESFKFFAIPVGL